MSHVLMYLSIRSREPGSAAGGRRGRWVISVLSGFVSPNSLEYAGRAAGAHPWSSRFHLRLRWDVPQKQGSPRRATTGFFWSSPQEPS